MKKLDWLFIKKYFQQHACVINIIFHSYKTRVKKIISICFYFCIVLMKIVQQLKYFFEYTEIHVRLFIFIEEVICAKTF